MCAALRSRMACVPSVDAPSITTISMPPQVCSKTLSRDLWRVDAPLRTATITVNVGWEVSIVARIAAGPCENAA